MLSNKLTEKLIDNLLMGKELKSIEQNKDIKPFYGQTPKFFDFMKLFLKIKTILSDYIIKRCFDQLSFIILL